MKVFELLRRHAAVVVLATVLACVLGVVSALRLPSGIYPEVEFPRIVVVARSGGAPADVFTTSVTRPLEQALASVQGIERIRSKTIRGATEVSLLFAPDTDMGRALALVESRSNEARSSLPAGTEITVERITTGSFPVVTFNVSGPIDPRELRELSDYVVRPALANVRGVGRIEVLGGDTREVQLILDPDATAALHLSSELVAARLRASLGLIATGRVERDRQLVTVVGDAQPLALEDLRAIPIATGPGGAVVPLSSIAEVFEGAEDRTVRVGGPRGETVSVSVARLPGASTPDVVDGAKAAIVALGPTLPSGVTIDPVYDQASLVHESMASVRDAILLGIALAAAVIALFLRDLRAGAIAAASVPLALAMTFVAMAVAHQTLNLMSLGGMAVAIGLVVDDAIVVIEAVARHRDAGEPPFEAAAKGASDMAPAILGTTLTTVLVFAPMAFLQGVVGDFFRALAFTVTSAVLASMLIALVLVPLAAGRVLKATPSAAASRIDAAYGRLVRRLAAHPKSLALGLVVVLAVGALAGRGVERGFLPSMDEGAFVVDYFLPAGTSLTTTDAYARRIETELAKTPEVRTFTRRTGAELGPAAATQVQRGDIMVRLAPSAERRRSGEDIIAALRKSLARDLPEVRIEFVQVLQDVLNDLAGNPRPIELKILGPDEARLHEIGDGLAKELGGVQGVVDLYDGHEGDAPELRLVARRDAMARFGVTPEDVNTLLGSVLYGTTVGSLRRFDRLVGVRMRYPDPVRYDAARLPSLPFSAAGHTTTLDAVARAEWSATSSLRLHEALSPMVDVTADHEGRDLGAIATDVDRIVAATKLPTGYRIVLGGQIESERETLKQLGGIGAIAVLLVLTVLAGQFRRFRLAPLVLVSIPIAIVGALLALVVTRQPLNASSLMGCVLLVGLVVKNGILLLEEAERLLETGQSAEDAVAHACERRLRPVLMTTVATLAGLVPLALGLGAGADLQKPLAIAVIGGLVTSTLATLGALPPLATRLLRT